MNKFKEVGKRIWSYITGEEEQPVYAKTSSSDLEACIYANKPTGRAGLNAMYVDAMRVSHEDTRDSNPWAFDVIEFQKKPKE